MGELTLTSIGLLGVFIILSSVGQLCMKVGVRATATSAVSGRGVLRSVAAAVAKAPVLVGIGLYVLAGLAWLPLISRVRLSIAYPMVSLSYVVVVVLSAGVLREQVRWRRALPGLLLIGVGVSLIGLGSGPSRPARGGRPQPSVAAARHWHSLPALTLRRCQAGAVAHTPNSHKGSQAGPRRQDRSRKDGTPSAGSLVLLPHSPLLERR